MADEIVRIEADAEEIDEVINTLKNCDIPGHIADTNNPHQVTKAQVGLGNVDNTSDADKPISAAVQAQLARLIDAGAKNLFNVDKIDTAGTYNADYDIVNGKISVSTTGSYGRLSCRLNLPAGAYKFATLASDINISGGAAEIRIVTDASGSGTIAFKAIEDGECVIAFTLATEQTIFLMFYLNRSSSSYANSASFESIMLCTAANYDISPEFVPYAPTNRELYEAKADTSELHALLPNITSSTTIRDYVDSLSKGVYTAFIANVSNPSDSPINANCFVNIYVYSATTAAVELIPISYNELQRTYTMRKTGGTWREWYMVEGTPVTSSTQSTAALMSAKSTSELDVMPEEGAMQS